MEVADDNVCDQCYGFITVTTGEGNRSEPEDDDRNQVTPQQVLESLPRYVIRSKSAYADNLCGICYCKYCVGDQIICLPCQHNFHDYCIENWLKWVRFSCPIDKKSVVRRKFMDDVVNERRHHLLGTNLNHEVNAEAYTTDEDNTSSATKEVDNFHTGSPQKILGKSHEFKTVNEDEAANVCSLKILSPTEDVKSETPTDHMSPDVESKKLEIFCNSNDFKGNEKSRRNRKESSRKYPQKLRDSVDVIRKNLKTERPKIKKIEIFDLALDKATAKLSEVNIHFPKHTSDNYYQTENLRKTVSSLTSSKNKVTEQVLNREGAMKRNLTFSELSEIGNKKKSGWTYMRNKQLGFEKFRSK